RGARRLLRVRPARDRAPAGGHRPRARQGPRRLRPRRSGARLRRLRRARGRRRRPDRRAGAGHRAPLPLRVRRAAAMTPASRLRRRPARLAALAATLLVAGAISGCTASRAEDPGDPALEVVADDATSYSFDAPAEVTAGAQRLSLRNTGA